MKAKGSAVGWVILLIAIVVIGAWISCAIGAYFWNDMIAGRFGWTEPITKWDFFKLEIIADSLLWFAALFKGNSKKSND